MPRLSLKLRTWLLAGTALATACGSCTPTDVGGGSGEPHIEFTYVPPYGSIDDLRGRVRHVRPASYRVAVYIRLGGWWTKPYWNLPLTSIRADGTWTCDITTGGIDERATVITAFLVPAGYSPRLMSGGTTLPAELEGAAAAKAEVTRQP